jgi:2,4-dichlorophenol 6-monooxygenase
VSTLDLVGKGKVSLVTGIAGQAWADAAKEMDLQFLRTLVIGSPAAKDVYCSWQAVREIEEPGALLVRPDGVVAWRQRAGVADTAQAKEELEQALASLLNQKSRVLEAA